MFITLSSLLAINIFSGSQYGSTLLWLTGMFGGPIEAIEQTPASVIWSMKDDIKIIAKEWQLFDYDEHEGYSSYGFPAWSGEDNAIEDLIFLYLLYQELKDVEKIEEFLPKYIVDINDIEKYLTFNQRFQRELKNRINWETDRLDVLLPTLEESEKCEKIWGLIYRINNHHANLNDRRLSYQELKTLIGKDFDKPERPVFVPEWRFSKPK